MDKNEFKEVVALLNTIYSEKPPCPDQITFACWFKLLGDKPKSVVVAACESYISTEHFPPKPADIIERCVDITTADIPNELEAWAMVYKAICNSTYNAQKEFDRLPPLVQKAIGTPDNLKEMAKMEIDTVNSVEQSHFINVYRTVIARSKTEQQLPTETRKSIEQIRISYGLPIKEDPNVLMIAGDEIPNEVKQEIIENPPEGVVGTEYVEKLRKDMNW